MFQAMALFLPIHIWARELDSRILLAVKAAAAGVSSCIGNEYGIVPLYSRLNDCLLFRAGRPRPNYRAEWNKAVLSRGGIATIVDEEGGNDMERLKNSREFRDAYWPDISRDAVAMCSSIHYSCQLERSLILSATKPEEQDQINEKLEHRLNLRLELLTANKGGMFAADAKSLYSIFGKFVLIVDNFGATLFGEENNANVSAKAFLGSSLSAEREAAIEKRGSENRLEAEIFANIIKETIAAYPDTQFIFRPHPISSVRVWSQLLGDHRNLHIIYQGTVDAWILASQAMIHSGCTTGVHAAFLGKGSLDISSLTSRSELKHRSISSRLSQEVESVQELKYSLEKALRTNSAFLEGNDIAMGETDSLSPFADSVDEVNRKLPEELRFSQECTSTSLLNNAILLAKRSRMSSASEADEIKSYIQELDIYPLNQSKSIHLTREIISRKISGASRALGLSDMAMPKWSYDHDRRILIVSG